MIVAGQHPFAPVFVPLWALHTLDGRYVDLDDAAFRRIGVDAEPLLGRTWQDFAPGADVDVESEAIRRALHGGQPVKLPAVRRSWGRRAILLAVTVTPVRTAGGALLIRREAHVLDTTPAPVPRNEADGPMAALRGLAGLA